MPDKIKGETIYIHTHIHFCIYLYIYLTNLLIEFILTELNTFLHIIYIRTKYGTNLGHRYFPRQVVSSKYPIVSVWINDMIINKFSRYNCILLTKERGIVAFIIIEVQSQRRSVQAEFRLLASFFENYMQKESSFSFQWECIDFVIVSVSELQIGSLGNTDKYAKIKVLILIFIALPIVKKNGRIDSQIMLNRFFHPHLCVCRYKAVNINFGGTNKVNEK